MANDVIARGLALRGISDAAAAVRATEKMVEITSITGSGSNRTLTGNARIITQLEGHTDERGSREYNIALGERRANSVRQAMIATGVSPQQIRVVSFGEERPAAAGQSEQSYALNRRVEIVY